MNRAISRFVAALVVLAFLVDASTAAATFTPTPNWATWTQSGADLVFTMESQVAGSSPNSRSRMRIDLDSATPDLEVEETPGV